MNDYFMMFLFIIGLILISMIGWLEYNLPEKFILTRTFTICLRLLLVTSTIFIILPISSYICNNSCSGDLNLYIPYIGKINTDIIYYIILFILGIIMIVCGAIINGEITQDINKPILGIIGIGVCLLLFSIFGIVWKHYKDKNMTAEEAKEKEKQLAEENKREEQRLLEQEIEDAENRAREADKKAKKIKEDSLRTFQKEREEQLQRQRREKEDEIARKRILEAELDTKKAEAEAEKQRELAEASRLRARQKGFFPKGTINSQGPSTIYTEKHTSTPESKTTSKISDTGLGWHTIFE